MKNYNPEIHELIEGGYRIKSVPIPEIPIRVISLRAFFERIPSASRKLIKKSNSEGVQDVMEGLRLSTYVDLDSPITTRDLTTLITEIMVTQDEVNTLILIDGQEYEKYNGVL